MTKAEVGMMLPQAKEHLGPPESGKGVEGASSIDLRESMVLSTP